jgi:hypothetical protein
VEFGIVQMNEISSRYKQGVIFENEESCDDLLHCYTRLLLVAFSGQKDLVQTIDPGVILNILVALNGKNQELILSGVELAKEKFNSSIRNSIEDVRKVTDFLLQLMNGDNLLVSASALDCFFDVYTEEDYN